jgi:peptidoglycan L-alanyl-D-glutamate endopeptidase CwlK
MSTTPNVKAEATDERHEALDLLWAPLAARCRMVVAACGARGLAVDVFETWRSPMRQGSLYAQGRTAPGKVVTKADAWESFHQYGLATDLVFRSPSGGWTWDGDWAGVDAVVRAVGGLERVAWEKPHVQMTGGLAVADAMKIYARSGLQAVWLEVARRLVAGGVKL